MRIGINFTPPHTSAEEWAQIIASNGFCAASFPVNYKASQSVIDAYVRAAKDRDIRIAEVGVWNSPHDPDPKKRAEAREACLEQFRLAEYIHADCCVNVSGAAGPVWYGCYAGNFEPSLYEENVRFLQDLIDTVHPKHTCYSLETMQWMVPWTAEQYMQVVKDVNREGFGIHLDMCNLIFEPYSYTHQREWMDQTFDLMSTGIRSAHIKDIRLMPGTTVNIEEVPIGTGEFDLAYYLGKLAELPVDTPVLIEHLNTFSAYVEAWQVIKKYNEVR